MRIATWNINGLRARFEFVRAWLKQREPDIVGLQELKMADQQFPHAEFEALGYHSLVHGQKAWNGVAILSRERAQLVQTGLPGQPDLGARFIVAEIANIEFATAYCPNGKHLEHEDYARKLAWFDALAEYQNQPGSDPRARILCGDFNICPDDLDSWDPVTMAGEIFHTDAERARMQALYDLDLQDLFRRLNPDEPAFSWWDYRGGAFHRGHGLRIDFLLGNEAIRERLQCVTIDREWRKKKDGLTASDHAPVFADLA